MQRLPSRGKGNRPQPLQTKSFHRFSPSPEPPTSRSRSSTLPGLVASDLQRPSGTLGIGEQEPDPFDTNDEEIGSPMSESGPESPYPEGYDQLPTEIQSLLEKFLESLSAKIHPAPLSIDRLAELFQEFYLVAESHIATHVASLSTRLNRPNRKQSPAPSISSTTSRSSKSIARRLTNPTAPPDGVDGTQRMLTPAEITDRRRGRRQLELKRLALEDAVERAVCEKLYPRMWRHRSTDDEERDEKLRSRAAALSLVGVGLEELLTTALANDQDAQDALQPESDSGEKAKELLASARESLESMNAERYPVGKLNCLKETHKHIVETLSKLFPSSSSADEILPTLIYTIITSQPESISVISNLNFIERFRGATKIDGETAYCLTNFEAAISFLETVDLSSIRPEETSELLSRYTSHPSTPIHERPDPLYRGLPGKSLEVDGQLSQYSPLQARNRRLSSLIQSRSRPFEISTDGMKAGAEDAFDTIHSALDGSFKFLFGRLREKQAHASPEGSPDLRIPKTLEDARKLVSTPPPGEDDVTSFAGNTLPDTSSDALEEHSKDGTLSPLTPSVQRASIREPSADSTQSVGSAKRVAFVERRSSGQIAKSRGDSPKAVASNATASAQPALAYNAVESMRSLGSTLNPLKSFGGMGMMRGFGRSSSGSNTATASSAVVAATVTPAVPGEPVSQKAAISFSGVAPPIKRFVEIKEPKELTFFDVEILLRDYQRLAGALREVAGLEAA